MTVQLEYIPLPRSRRRWWTLTFLGIVVAMTAVAYWQRGWLGQKWERGRLLYLQSICLKYSPPTDEIVYDQDPAGKSKLLESPGYVPYSTWGWFTNTFIAAAKVPECWVNFARYGATGLPKMLLNSPVIFMHERITLSGRRYLVVLRGDSIPFHQIGQLNVDFEFTTPASWRDWPQDASGIRAYNGLVIPEIPNRMTIYAGQADPNDRSHFTIRYVEGGFEHVVDGWARDVSSTWSPVKVEFVPRF